MEKKTFIGQGNIAGFTTEIPTAKHKQDARRFV